MTARFPNGRPTSEEQSTTAGPAAPALQRGEDAAPAKTLSGAFKAALGKPAQMPHTFDTRKNGKGLKSALNAGPSHGPERQPVLGPAAPVPRKGHR